MQNLVAPLKKRMGDSCETSLGDVPASGGVIRSQLRLNTEQELHIILHSGNYQHNSNQEDISCSWQVLGVSLDFLKVCLKKYHAFLF